MYARSLVPRWRLGIIDELLNALFTVPAAAIFVTPKIHLFTGSLIVSSATTQAELVAAEATFSGYLSEALGTMDGPLTLLEDIRGFLKSYSFIEGDPATITENITGYWVDEGAVANWVVGENFPEPLAMAAPGDFISLDLLLPLALLVPASLA